MLLSRFACFAPAFAAMALFGRSTMAANQGPVAHWKFDERRGPTAFDSAGSSNGVLVGGATFAPSAGVAGGAINVSTSTNGCVNMGNILPFTGGVNFSICSWIKFATPGDPTGSRVFVGRHVSGIVAGYFNAVNGSGGCYGLPKKAWFYTSDSCGGETIGTTDVNDGDWHFVVSTYAAGKIEKIYVDGVEEGTKSPSVINAVGSAAFMVGGIIVGSTPTGLFEGLIDDVQVYNRALFPCEIESMYAAPGSIAPGSPSDLNGDGEVDGADLGLLLSGWSTPGADLNGDGTTDGADLGLLLSDWGSC